MEKHISQNGIKYERKGEQYSPMFVITEQEEHAIGKYGIPLCPRSQPLSQSKTAQKPKKIDFAIGTCYNVENKKPPCTTRRKDSGGKANEKN